MGQSCRQVLLFICTGPVLILYCSCVQMTQHLFQELRRGADPACIYSLSFSKGDSPDWLAVSSDKGTIHVFSLHNKLPAVQESVPNGAPESGQVRARNPLSALSFVSVSKLPVAAVDRSVCPVVWHTEGDHATCSQSCPCHTSRLRGLSPSCDYQKTHAPLLALDSSLTQFLSSAPGARS